MRRRGFLKSILGVALGAVGGFYGWRPGLGGPTPVLAWGWTVKHDFQTGVAGVMLFDDVESPALTPENIACAMDKIYDAGPVDVFLGPPSWGA